MARPLSDYDEYGITIPEVVSTVMVLDGQKNPNSAILFVDLNGTLLVGDALHEGIVVSARINPRGLIGSFAQIALGRAAFKTALAATTDLPSDLPVNHAVMEVIASAQKAGRQVVLATATSRAWAVPIAQRLGCFDDVIAVEGRTNLRGEQKRLAIEAYCRDRGIESFDYVGNDVADLPVWRSARQRLVVAPSRSLRKRLNEFCNPVIVGSARGSWLRELIRLLRPNQWIKNLLILVPLITSHRIFSLPELGAATLAIICFSLGSSAVYVLNDMLDVTADRRHPVKRRRPFATGQLPLALGPPLAAALGLVALGLAAATLPAEFLLGLTVYGLVTTAYSLGLKRVPILDVIVLACLYTMRVLCGGLAAGVAVSSWLLTFSLFIFSSLAFAKRHAELARHADEGTSASASDRGYHAADLPLIESLGLTNGLIAVLVLALYLQSDQMRTLYTHELPLWLLCPLLLYWVGRLWRKVKRRELDEDPVVFAATDGVSLAVAVLGAVLLALSA